jgi:hypothetical protein
MVKAKGEREEPIDDGCNLCDGCNHLYYYTEITEFINDTEGTVNKHFCGDCEVEEGYYIP